jgi:hypothetical protein
MIKAPTVLVLGAGASQPYGFPLGAGLVDQLCAEIIDTPQGGMVKRLNRIFNPVHIDRFAHALRDTRPYSVDTFLEMRQEFRDVGKAAIADILLRAEDDRQIETAPIKTDWYRYLFNRVLILRDQTYYSAQANKLTIVTFNFDRSFERALFKTLRSAYAIDAQRARELTTELQVHHIHGVLGDADWLYPDSAEATAFGGREDDGQVRVAVERARAKIKIVDEEIEESVLEDVEVVLRKAAYVYFLGFGFDERNLAKLRTPEKFRHTNATRGTAFNWSAAELVPVQRYFSHAGSGADPIHLYNTDVISFLRECAEALFC